MNQSNTATLRLDAVTRSYQLGPITTEVLRGIDLEVSDGELVSIMGPSGSGKTTLMNIIGLLDRPSSGKFLLNGQDISNVSDNALSSLRNTHIGFVFQSFHLLPHLNAVENVILPLMYRGTSRSAAKKRALDILKRVGLKDRSHHRPDQLSGGQKQRVAIARALVGDPALILADEPTGALDEATAKDVMNLLLQLHVERRVTILIITHDAQVARQCVRQVRIDSGKLSEAGVDAMDHPFGDLPPDPMQLAGSGGNEHALVQDA